MTVYLLNEDEHIAKVLLDAVFDEEKDEDAICYTDKYGRHIYDLYQRPNGEVFTFMDNKYWTIARVIQDDKEYYLRAAGHGVLFLKPIEPETEIDKSKWLSLISEESPA